MCTAGGPTPIQSTLQGSDQPWLRGLGTVIGPFGDGIGDKANTPDWQALKAKGQPTATTPSSTGSTTDTGTGTTQNIPTQFAGRRRVTL